MQVLYRVLADFSLKGEVVLKMENSSKVPTSYYVVLFPNKVQHLTKKKWRESELAISGKSFPLWHFTTEFT